MVEPERPDPDALLRRLQAEERRDARAKLKIFFGFAPGVGKTYRMLQVARELKAQGRDVLVGVVETHGRKETAALLEGLEVLPRRQIEYRGHTLHEFDLDAALARRPALILLDELAHTNPEGSRHGKRFRDVLELLDAGIDVFATVNVQHIESLNDVIAQITHVRVRETVPDALLERADEIELVDISPEQLLQRLEEGKVYLPDQARVAASRFFQRGNLLALRELALRHTAEYVESDVQEYREEHDVSETWPSSERVLVSVSASPASAKLVRAAKRMAAGLRAPWVAAYVETSSRAPLGDRDAQRLEVNLRLAESLGASVIRLSGADVAGPLLAYARRHNATRLIVGKPTHARWRDRLRGSLLDAVVRGSGNIEVHVISGDPEREGEERETASDRQNQPLRSYAFAALLVTVTTALGFAARGLYSAPDLGMLYLVAVAIAAFRFGRGPSLLAAFLSVGAYDFFFVPPYLTMIVHDTRNVLTFVMMFLVSVFLSTLTTRLRRQEQDAIVREERATALHALSRDLGALLDPGQSADVVARHAADSFRAAAFVLTPNLRGELAVIATAPRDLTLGPTDLGVAEWTFAHGRLAGLGTETLPGARVVCGELRVGPVSSGVIALAPQSGQGLRADERSLFEALCRQAAFAFERARLSEQARVSGIRAKTEELRSSLLSTLSHDLRTPLAVVTGAATALRDDADLPVATRRELIDTICEETERQERLIANLLDITRLETGGLSPRREWVPVDELVGAALTRLEQKLSGRKVQVDVAGDFPLLWVDPVLMQQVFINLFENAAKYTPSECVIEVQASSSSDALQVAVADRGPGIPAGEEEHLFEKFVRGSHPQISGVGLGLAICRGIVEAHGGIITAENRAGGGALFRVRLPLPEETPPDLDAKDD